MFYTILPFMFDNFCNKEEANKNANPKRLICKMELKKNIHTKLPKSLELCRKAVLGKFSFDFCAGQSEPGERLFFLYLITF